MEYSQRPMEIGPRCCSVPVKLSKGKLYIKHINIHRLISWGAINAVQDKRCCLSIV